jgi:hypothetical protein
VQASVPRRDGGDHSRLCQVDVRIKVLSLVPRSGLRRRRAIS